MCPFDYDHSDGILANGRSVRGCREGDLIMPEEIPADDNLLLAVEQLGAAHDRNEAERSDATSSQNSAGDDGDNRDLNLPRE
jgi:hypothetical protein